MDDKIREYMREALKEAEEAEKYGEVPVGAVIVENGVIIGRGRNRIVEQNDPTSHAELIAIKETVRYKQYNRLDNCDLFVTMEPCPMCAGAIVLARIKKVVFGVFDQKSGASGSLYNILQDNRLNHRCEVENGVLADESRILLQKFFQQLRNKHNNCA